MLSQLYFLTLTSEDGLNKELLESVLTDILRVLDKNSITASDTMLIADMLYEVASAFEKVATDPSGAASMLFRPSSLERFPLSRQRWGYDPSLIRENN